MEILITEFGRHEEAIRAIRESVFCQEQGVALEEEWDGKDAKCVHVLALVDAKPVGTGRLSREGRIGRIAVLKSHRKQGAGAKIIDRLVEEARNRKLGRVFLHAQVRATAFYEKKGFKLEGAAFSEAGIEHVLMTRDLD